MTPGQFNTKWRRIRDQIPVMAQDVSNEVFNLYSTKFPQIASDTIYAALGESARGNEEVIQDFIRSFVANNNWPKLQFSLRAAADKRVKGVSGGALRSPETITADDVEAWVRAGAEGSVDNDEGKVFDSRDSGETVDRVVKKMIGILIGRDDVQQKVTSDISAARDHYNKHVAEFVNRHGTGSSATWLIEHAGPLILRAWIAEVRATWPEVASRHLHQLIQG